MNAVPATCDEIINLKYCQGTSSAVRHSSAHTTIIIIIVIIMIVVFGAVITSGEVFPATPNNRIDIHMRRLVSPLLVSKHCDSVEQINAKIITYLYVSLPFQCQFFF